MRSQSTNKLTQKQILFPYFRVLQTQPANCEGERSKPPPPQGCSSRGSKEPQFWGHIIKTSAYWICGLKPAWTANSGPTLAEASARATSEEVAICLKILHNIYITTFCCIAASPQPKVIIRSSTAHRDRSLSKIFAPALPPLGAGAQIASQSGFFAANYPLQITELQCFRAEARGGT